MRISLLPAEWLQTYCRRRGLAAINDSTPGIIRYPRTALIKWLSAHLCERLNRPSALAIEVRDLKDEREARHIILSRVRDFVSLAGTLVRDRDFIVECLLAASRESDPELYGHQVRVSVLCSEMAKEMGLPEEELSLAGLLHDFGKIGIPKEILNKLGAWTESEMRMRPIHLQIAMTVVGAIESLADVARVLRFNHYYNGYPEGIISEDIPLEGQVLSAADYYDALTNPRPSRNGAVFAPRAALAEVEARRHKPGVKTPYDPRIIAVLEKLVLS